MPRPAKTAVTCEICGKEWEVKPSRARQNNAITCSRECLSALRKRNQIAYRGSADTRTANCATCGKQIERKPSQLAKYPTSYCSRECKHVGDFGPQPERQNGTWYPCANCSTPVRRTPATVVGRVFCSRACSHAANSGLRGPRVDRIIRPCANDCGQVLRLQPSHAKRYKYCSWRCAAESIQGAKRGLPGNEWTEEARLKLSRTLQAKFENEWRHRREEASERMSGRGNPQYVDGRARTLYAPGFTRTLKRQIARRDGFRCRVCDAPQRPGTHVVHHIDGAKHDHRPRNLVLLCHRCHGRVHHRMRLAEWGVAA